MSEILSQAAGNGGTITQIFTGITAVIAAIAAWRLNKRDSDADELRNLKRKVGDLQQDQLAMKQYVYALRSTYADHGITTADPPRLRSEDWG